MSKAAKKARTTAPRPGGARRPARARTSSHIIPAGEFKAVCLNLMEHVKQTGQEYVITKRGQPIVRLAPLTGADLRPFVGRSHGVITADREALLAPLHGDWEVDADL